MWIVTVCLATHQHGLELGQPGPHAPGHRRCAHALCRRAHNVFDDDFFMTPRRPGVTIARWPLLPTDRPLRRSESESAKMPTHGHAIEAMEATRLTNVEDVTVQEHVCRLHPPVLPGRGGMFGRTLDQITVPLPVTALPAASPARVPSTAQASVLSSLHRLRRRLRSPPTDFQHTWRLSAVPTAAPRPP